MSEISSKGNTAKANTKENIKKNTKENTKKKRKPSLEVLVASMNSDGAELVKKMNICSDAVVVNQCDHYSYEEADNSGRKVRIFNMKEKGVGLSRNTSMMRAEGDILLFSDEDIVYDEGYEEKILTAFKKHKDADMLIFNVRVGESRFTYYTEKEIKVGLHNCGRYPTYSMAVKREKLHKSGVTFSLLFGGGAKYSAGEDSLFLMDCIKKGFRVYALPVEIGQETERTSTWFNGYTEKFFYDRGVLYTHLYGFMAVPLGIRFILKKKNVMCQKVKTLRALSLLLKGIRDAK